MARARASTRRGSTAIDPCGPCDTADSHCDDQQPPVLYRKHVIAPTGFQDARDRLEYEWIAASGNHVEIDSENWGNTIRRHQCNGTDAISDGQVVTLATCGEITEIAC